MSTQNNKVFTVAEVAALPDNEWVNGSVTAHVVKVETVPKKAGGNFWKVHLSDGGGDTLATMSAFTAPKYQAGDDIRMSGSGIKKESYMGKCQIKTGKETVVDVKAGAPRVQAAAQQHSAEQANGALINGNAVGNAMSNAWETARYVFDAAELKEQLTSPKFWDWFYTVCSDHLRIGRALEAGKLRPTVSERSHQMPAQPPPRPEVRQAQPVVPNGSPEGDFDAQEDAPF